MRPITILYILVTYVVLQFSWWAYLLTSLNDEVYRHKLELATLRPGSSEESTAMVADLEKKLAQRKLMVVGEGIVFLSLLVWGSLVTRRSFLRDMELARLQKNFLLSITHEFKSPLASIKLQLETISRRDLGKDQQQQFIRNALLDTDRLNTLVENALMANLIEHDGHFFASEKVDLSGLMIKVQNEFERVPGHPVLESDIQEGILVNGDRQALSILAMNLLENAVKYSPKGSPISISLQAEHAVAVFTVGDRGIGIPDKEKELVFRKFYRSGNEMTRNTKGTGLGLYLVKYITAEHRGEVFVKDRHPNGTDFIVRLPLLSA